MIEYLRKTVDWVKSIMILRSSDPVQ